MMGLRPGFRKMLKDFLPLGFVHLLRLTKARRETLASFRFDARRYLKYMGPPDDALSQELSRTGVESQVYKDCHRVEKGLALQSPRRPFGLGIVDRLSSLMPQIKDDHLRGYAISALDALEQWNRQGVILDTAASLGVPDPGGWPDAELFFASRHSVRDFSSSSGIDPDVLRRAVKMAMSTPSVCNRQPWSVRFTDDPITLQKWRSHQNGNDGIENIPTLGLITVDLGLFAGPGERNQAWIEGGLFGMTLVWGLHALGLQTCILNTSHSAKEMVALQSDLGLEDQEAVIFMVAIGYGAEGYRVTRSPRRPLAQILR